VGNTKIAGINSDTGYSLKIKLRPDYREIITDRLGRLFVFINATADRALLKSRVLTIDRCKSISYSSKLSIDDLRREIERIWRDFEMWL
jgi:hypothetical protein